MDAILKINLKIILQELFKRIVEHKDKSIIENNMKINSTKKYVS